MSSQDNLATSTRCCYRSRRRRRCSTNSARSHRKSPTWSLIGSPFPCLLGRRSRASVHCSDARHDTPPRAPSGHIVDEILASFIALGWKGGDCLPRLPEQIRNQTTLRSCLFRMKPVLIGAVRLALRCSTAGAVKAAHSPAPHRGSLAPLARALRGCRAPRALLERINRVHEVRSVF